MAHGWTDVIILSTDLAYLCEEILFALNYDIEIFNYLIQESLSTGEIINAQTAEERNSQNAELKFTH